MLRKWYLKLSVLKGWTHIIKTILSDSSHSLRINLERIRIRMAYCPSEKIERKSKKEITTGLETTLGQKNVDIKWSPRNV